MGWKKLLSDNRVTAEPPSKAELDSLRSIVTRSLKDVTTPGLSADTRFVLAYDAARTLSLILVRAEGYRPRSVGAHYNTFLALEAVDPAFKALSVYFDGCRMKRNNCEYDFAGGVSDCRGRERPENRPASMQRSTAARRPWGCGSCRDRDALNADELKPLLRYTLRFEAQLDRLANALAHFVERTRLGMTPRKLRD
jgi:hypothetical protein